MGESKGVMEGNRERERGRKRECVRLSYINDTWTQPVFILNTLTFQNNFYKLYLLNKTGFSINHFQRLSVQLIPYIELSEK